MLPTGTWEIERSVWSPSDPILPPGELLEKNRRGGARE
jgi:hypothetical protein